MDSLNYHYGDNNNKLNYVSDAVSSKRYSIDIDDQSQNNYQYDLDGNLSKDIAEQIQYINWYANGKIKSITKTMVLRFVIIMMQWEEGSRNPITLILTALTPSMY
ncbi:MAG: hypothetical protein IPL98_13100 [Saprospiraceae bacterium]|nr:hypothetical protein [Saprospiraceae bacterium]